MRTLIEYIRQIFCKHDYLIEEKIVEYEDSFGGYKKGYKVYMRCKKCGYHHSHWKY